MDFDYILMTLHGQVHECVKFCYSTRPNIGWERAFVILKAGVKLCLCFMVSFNLPVCCSSFPLI